jgi:hypothetical protein
MVTTLANGVTQLQQERMTLQGQLAAATEQKKQDLAERDKLLKERDDQIAALQGKVEQDLATTASYRQSNLRTVQNVQNNATSALTQQQQSNEQLSSQLAQATDAIKKKDAQIAELSGRLKGIRVGTNEPTIQKPDGRIVRVPDNNTVVIDLGIGDQLVQGMTFEVYDQQSGIPALGDAEHALGNADMPEGKASIEVIKMLPGYSECRVIRRKPGYGIVIGDLISNLVYDSTQKYNFVVYGDFDLNNDGRPEPGDSDVIKQLVTRWGGNITNDVNISTDFIVMGVEPKAEPARADDDALVKQQKLEAQQALDQYLNVLKEASSLNIPIMNQNRFLNFVGYKSQVTR